MLFRSKRFTESYILGEVLTQRMRGESGAVVEHKQGLGNTAIVFAALKTGAIDVYPEYTGTLAFELLGLKAVPSLSVLNALLAPHGVQAGVPLGFGNAYALAMSATRAKALGISSLSDLARHANLRYGLTQEFLNRKDGWPGLQAAYALSGSTGGLDHGLAFAALRAGSVDVIDVYTTDAQIERQGLAVLAPSGGVLTDPTTIMILGVDENANSDTIQVMRFDPERQLLATLAIPRDLRVPVPGYGDQKINAAYATGGPALALKTVADYTGLPIDHVMIVDFNGLVQIVDALGGITIDNPDAMRSVFGGALYTFPKGRQTLNGQEALAYSRIRKNILNPSDSDITRGQHQQLVIQAIRSKLASPGGLLRLRNVATSLKGAFATDLTLAQLLEYGYLDARASTRLRCNLGGTPAPIGGQDVLVPDGAGKDRKSTRLNSSHVSESRMPSSA